MKTERIIPAAWRLDDSIRPVRVVAGDIVICEIPQHAGGLDVEIGRRIVAAPELLEALQECLYGHPEVKLTPDAIAMARAAITKATKEPA